MKMSKRMGVICVGTSLVALVLSVVIAATRPDESEVADRVYSRLLDEAWTEAEPGFRNLGLPTQKPRSFGELLRPVFAWGETPPPGMTTPPSQPSG